MNIGEKYAVFETGTRNTGTSLTGKDVANPAAFIRASVDLLCYLGLNDHANLISDALFRALTEQRVHTKDIGGEAKTHEIVDAVLVNIEEEMRKHGRHIGH
jgi:isocitrate dehydrogenase (NAD+)